MSVKFGTIEDRETFRFEGYEGEGAMWEKVDEFSAVNLESGLTHSMRPEMDVEEVNDGANAFRKAFRAITEKANAKFPDDAEKAVRFASREIRKHPKYDELVSALAADKIRGGVERAMLLKVHGEMARRRGEFQKAGPKRQDA